MQMTGTVITERYGDAKMKSWLRRDRGEVDIIGPSEGLVASSILAGRANVIAASVCDAESRVNTARQCGPMFR
jgi:hypothetical protein